MTKYRLILCLTASMLMFSGCSIKFIEKDEAPQETVAQPLPEQTEDVAEVAWTPEGENEVEGVAFIPEEISEQKFVTDTVLLKDIPSKKPNRTIQIARGTEVTMVKTSSDLIWAEIEYQGERWFINQEYLADEYIDKTPVMTEEVPETVPGLVIDGSAGNHPETEPVYDEEENPPETEQATESEVWKDSNIHYPDVPSAAIEIAGISFEDFSKNAFQAEIINGQAPVYTTPSADGVQVAVFSETMKVSCTAVGENGWCRILPPTGITLPDGVDEIFVETKYLLAK